MKNAMLTISTVLLGPFVFLNTIAPIAAIIWLVIIGESSLLVKAIIALVIAPFAYSVAMLPALPFAIIASKFTESGKAIGKIIGYPLLLIVGIWTYALMSVWTLYVFTYTPEIYQNQSIPHLLLAYAISTSAFSYMASKEPTDNGGAVIACLINQVSSLFLMALFLVTELNLEKIFIYYFSSVGVGFVLAIFSSGIGVRGSIKPQ